MRMAETIPEAAHKDVEDKWVFLFPFLRVFLEYVFPLPIWSVAFCGLKDSNQLSELVSRSVNNLRLVRHRSGLSWPTNLKQ